MIRVAFDGVVDMDRHDEVRGRLLSALQGADELRVNLSEVSYIDSSGLSALIETNQQAEAQGARLVLENVSEAVKRVMVVSCLDGLFTYEQVEQTATAEAPVDIGSADLELDDLGGLDSLDDPADSLESTGELDDFGDLDDLDLSLDDEGLESGAESADLDELDALPDLEASAEDVIPETDASPINPIPDQSAGLSDSIDDYDDDPLNQL